MYRLTLLLVLSLSFVTSASAIDLNGANGLVDFDAAVGFSTPRNLSVFRSADPASHMYFLVPNSIRLASKSSGDPEFSLFHYKARGHSTGYMNFTVEPIVSVDDFEQIIQEIKTNDPLAKFGVPQPVASYFYVVGPELPLQRVNPNEDSGNPLKTRSSFSTNLSSISIRASLQPGSHNYAIFTIGHNFKLRGVSRDEAGNAHIIDRSLATSFVMNGICANSPHLVLNLDSGKYGCITNKRSPDVAHKCPRKNETRSATNSPRKKL